MLHAISQVNYPGVPHTRALSLVSISKKILRTDKTLWKPPVQMLNTKEMTDTTFCTR